MVAHEPLVNKCFDHGIVPDVWKLEKIVHRIETSRYIEQDV